MTSQQPKAPPEVLARYYTLFASLETRQASPLYARLSTAVATDPELLALASHARKGQPVPNLLFAAVHFLLLKGTSHPLAAFYPSLSPTVELDADPYPYFRSFCLDFQEEIRQLLGTRLVQTNEVNRCVCLLPAFALAASHAPEQPLSLIEIGTSAGLNLLWDRYSYDYGEGGRYGVLTSPVQLTCSLRGDHLPPLPAVLPEVVWRVGLDLRPINISDPEERLWLRALVWPENTDRAERLQQAFQLLEQNPPPILSGDALALLPTVLASVPQETTLCIFHSFTINQFPLEARTQFTQLLVEWGQKRPLFWISLESPKGATPELALTVERNNTAVKQILARCEAHGRWLQWEA